MTDPLAIAPDLPMGTPEAGAPAAPPAAPAPPVDPPAAPAPSPTALGLLDGKGQAHDPAVHVSPPRLNVRGVWACKPGNAGRKAAGKPMVGAWGKRDQVPDQPKDATPAPEPAAPPVVTSTLVWSDDPIPGQPGEAAPVELRPREAYTATARSVVVAQFGIAQMAMGKAWDPEPAERKAWEQAWMDLMHHYQMPVVGPILGLIILAIDSIAKRRNDPETKERAKALWQSLMGTFRRPAPLPAPGHAEPPRPPPPPTTRPEVDTMAAYGR